MGQADHALDSFEEALSITRELNDRRWEAVHLGRLGDLFRFRGEFGVSLEHCLNGLRIAQEIGAKNVEGFLLESIGQTYRLLGQYDAAGDALARAMQLSIELQNQGHLIRRSVQTAQMELLKGNFSVALKAIPVEREAASAAFRDVTYALTLCALRQEERAFVEFNAALSTINIADLYQSQYLQALCLAGCGLLVTNPNERTLYLARAQEAYDRALTRCNAPGVVADAVQMLELLQFHERYSLIAPLAAGLAQTIQTKSTDRADVILEYAPDVKPVHELTVERTVARLRKVSRIRVKRRLSSGYSGAEVLLVDVEPRSGERQPVGPHYLKVQMGVGSIENPETVAHLRKTAIGRLIPEIVDYTIHEDRLALLYKPAQAGTINTQRVISLSRLIQEDPAHAVGELQTLCVALRDWNAAPQLRIFQPYDLIRHVLGSRRVKGDHSVQRRVYNSLKIDDQSVMLLFGGRLLLPNPLTFLSHPQMWQGQNAQGITVPIGHSHGDLHSGNIICWQESGDNHPPDILDFATYTDSGLVFFDLAYLEFDLLSRVFPLHTREGRLEVLNYIREVFSSMALPVSIPGGPVTQLCLSLHRPLRQNVIQMFGQRPDDFEVAYWLAAYTVGMNYARKRLPDDNKVLNLLGLIYAASALKNVLNYFEIAYNTEYVPSVLWIDREW